MALIAPGTLRRFVVQNRLVLKTRVGLRNALEVHIEKELEAYRDQRMPHDIGVFVSVDLVRPHLKPSRWVQEEETLLNESAARWAENNSVIMGKKRLRLFLLETMDDFIHVSPIDRPTITQRTHEATFEGTTPNGPTSFVVRGEIALARFADDGVEGIDDPYVSRERHALLRVEAGRVHVTACSSRNGTFVNGTQLGDGEERILFVGDELKVGRTVLHLQRVS